MVSFLKDQFNFSERRACKALDFARSTCRYSSVKKDDSELRKRVLHHAYRNLRFGYKRIYVLLRREGVEVNMKKVYRIYHELGLSCRFKYRKRSNHRGKFIKPLALHHNDQWSIDFVHDETFKKRKLRFLTVVDNFTREAPGILVDKKLKARDVVRYLDILTEIKGTPRQIICDNGPEFISGHFKEWASSKKIKLNFIRPGKPSDNAFIESFNSRFREEFLNANHFDDVEDAQKKAEDWIIYYNGERPHGSLSNKTPNEFKRLVRGVYMNEEQSTV